MKIQFNKKQILFYRLHGVITLFRVNILNPKGMYHFNNIEFINQIIIILVSISVNIHIEASIFYRLNNIYIYFTIVFFHIHILDTTKSRNRSKMHTNINARISSLSKFPHSFFSFNRLIDNIPTFQQFQLHKNNNCFIIFKIESYEINLKSFPNTYHTKVLTHKLIKHTPIHSLHNPNAF